MYAPSPRPAAQPRPALLLCRLPGGCGAVGPVAGCRGGMAEAAVDRVPVTELALLDGLAACCVPSECGPREDLKGRSEGAICFGYSVAQLC